MSYDLYNNLLSAPTPIQYQAGCQTGLREIPLHLLAYILSYIDNVADLARLCRTCRLLHYMTLPQLYKNVTLTSYDETIRTRDEKSNDDLWHASPFAMGLNALVTKKTANLVRSLSLEGDWNEPSLRNFKNRRLPDGSVMLNIAIRAAIEHCSGLQTFKYSLNTRPLLTLYSGLATLKNLRSFFLQFPSTSITQLQVQIPPLPQLREFTFTEYDPLCYPDDLSMLFFHAAKLESLTMHFTPRLGQANGPFQLRDFFHRNIYSKRGFELKSLAIHNVFLTPNPEVYQVFLPDQLEKVSFINSFGRANSDGKNRASHSLHPSWVPASSDIELDMSRIRMMRTDKINNIVVKDISSMPALEKIYFVNGNPPKARSRFGIQSPTPSRTSSSDCPTPIGPPIEVKTAGPRTSVSPWEVLRDNLINTVAEIQGQKLKHIILPTRLPVNIYNLSRLCASCPNLTQLAFAMEEIDPHALRQIGPSTTHLRCCRMLAPDRQGVEGAEQRKRFEEFEAREDHAFWFKMELSGAWGNSPLDTVNLKFIGIGQKVWETSSLHVEVKTIVDEHGDEMEENIYTRTVKPLTLQDVSDIALWKMDSFNV